MRILYFPVDTEIENLSSHIEPLPSTLISSSSPSFSSFPRHVYILFVTLPQTSNIPLFPSSHHPAHSRSSDLTHHLIKNTFHSFLCSTIPLISATQTYVNLKNATSRAFPRVVVSPFHSFLQLTHLLTSPNQEFVLTTLLITPPQH